MMLLLNRKVGVKIRKLQRISELADPCFGEGTDS